MRVLKSQTACLQAAAEVYRKVHGNEPFRMDDLAAWSIVHGLYPSPKRTSKRKAD